MNIIITGASKGIGRETALILAEDSSNNILAISRSGGLLETLSEAARHKNIDVLEGDIVSMTKEPEKLSMELSSRFSRIDVLINNAGVSMRATFPDVDLKVLHRLMDVNFWGTVYCTKYAIPYLIRQKGSLVGVSSVAGFHGLPGRTGYSASKFAVHGFLETIRIENLKKGLHVMIIAPGFTSSAIRMHALTADGTEQGESPRDEHKLMSPEYVAKWVLKGIRKKKRNKLLSWEGRLTALFQRILPDFVDWVYYYEMSKEPESPLK